MKIARQLIKSMTSEWKPEEYTDEYHLALEKMIEEKVHQDPEETPAPIKRKKASNSQLTFQIFLLTPEEVDDICVAYHSAKDSCYSMDLKSQCRTNPMVKFVESNLGYSCRLDNDLFFRNFLCMHRQMQKLENCTALIRGTTQPGREDVKCEKIPDFFACAKEPMMTACGDDSVTVMEQALEHYGCDYETKGMFTNF